MKIRVILFGTTLVLSVLLSSLAQNVSPGQEENPEQTQKSSFIRKDLLRQPGAEEDLQPPLRNIFSPRRPGSPGQGRDFTGVNPTDPSADTIAEDMDAEVEDFVETIDIRYIGYIRSQARTVALIFFEGEAMAVKNGEIIGEDVRIVQITPSEIQYTGPDSLPKTVSLEGEDR